MAENHQTGASARNPAHTEPGRAADTARSLQDTGRDAVDKTSDTARDMASKTTDVAQSATQAGRENVERGAHAVREGMQRAAENTSRMANRGMEIGSRAVGAYMESGREMSGALGDLNRAATEACTRSLNNYTDLSRQAADCRSFQDLIDLQATALEKIRDNLNAMTGVYSVFLNSFTKVLNPIVSRTTDVFNDREVAAAA